MLLRTCSPRAIAAAGDKFILFFSELLSIREAVLTEKAEAGSRGLRVCRDRLRKNLSPATAVEARVGVQFRTGVAEQAVPWPHITDDTRNHLRRRGAWGIDSACVQSPSGKQRSPVTEWCVVASFLHTHRSAVEPDLN